MDNDEYKRHPLNAGSRGMARDPAVLCEQAESRTCKGCVHEEPIQIAGSSATICSIGKGYGRRCNRYDEGKKVRW